MAKQFNRCIIKCGGTVWFKFEDGSVRDLGSIHGDDLAALAVRERVPIIRMTSYERLRETGVAPGHAK
jgi:hypothetical protein